MGMEWFVSPNRDTSAQEERILVLAPTGKDASRAVDLLHRNGIPALACRDLEEVGQRWDEGAGAVLMAEEAISRSGAEEFCRRLAEQPAWSDLPILILTGGGNISSTRMKALETFSPVGNVSFLERPFRMATLVSAIQGALRARRRQYQMRSTLESLRQGEERLRLALDTGRVAVWEWDLVQKRFTCSDRLFSFAGTGVDGFGETLVGFADFLHPEDAKAFLQALEDSKVFRREFDLEIRMNGTLGAPRRVHIRGGPKVDAQGRVIRIAGAATDITERVRAEQELRQVREGLIQSQKLEAIGKLAGGIAHDFNNMLTAINGYSELLLSNARGQPDLEEGLGEILKSGRRAAELTQQLLAYSRRQMMSFKPMDLNQAVQNMTGILNRLIREDIHIRINLASDLPPVMADMSQVEQIILNLVLNARDALPSGGRIGITTSLRSYGPAGSSDGDGIDPGRYVALSISDNGTGIDADLRARIFEPFFTTKEQGKGTGMGLSTVYGIVKQSAGHILVDSERGKGSTFTVLLPTTAASARPGQSSSKPEDQGASSATLLVVEDEEPVRNFLKRLLESRGFTVLSAASGEAALNLDAQYAAPIHLLITDVVMPGMNGRELANRMAARRPGIKVIFVSGYTDDALLQDGVLEPGRAFLNKPFSAETLLEKIAAALSDTVYPGARHSA